MQLISYLTSAISLGDGINFFQKIWFTITMFIEGLVFFLVSYAYKLFSLMCALNLNSLYAIIAPLVDRLKAVVMVFIVFKIGMALISYMLEPDKAPKGGKSLVINIAICAMFLVSYEFIFGLFNELSMLVMGVPEGYSFTVLSQFVDIEDGEDSGLIMRYVFGENQEVDVGDYIAYEVLCMFVRDSQGDSGQLMKALTSTKNSSTVRDGSYNFMNLSAVVPYINKTIEYTWFLPLLIGAYLIYQIVVNSVQIGVRMFKLLIMQIIAPIAIISIVDEKGIKSSTFQSFVKTYTSTLLNAFIRMLSFLIVTVFISKFFINIEEFLGTTVEDTGITKVLILCLVVVAGYKFAGDIPKFLNEALGTKFDFGEPKFGSFMSGVIGGTIGATTGLAAGIATGAGFAGTVGNMALGASSGATGMQKGKSISDKIKSVGATYKGNIEKGSAIARQGGGFAYLGQSVEQRLGVPQFQKAEAQKQSDNAKALDNMMAARSSTLSGIKHSVTDSAGHVIQDSSGKDIQFKYGDSADSYASQMLEYDSAVVTAKSKYESTHSDTAWKDYVAARDKATDYYKDQYNDQLFNNATVNADKSVKEASNIYDSRAKSTKVYDSGSGTYVKSKSVEDFQSSHGKGVKEQKAGFQKNQSDINNRGASRRADRQGQFGGK